MTSVPALQILDPILHERQAPQGCRFIAHDHHKPFPISCDIERAILCHASEGARKQPTWKPCFELSIGGHSHCHDGVTLTVKQLVPIARP